MMARRCLLSALIALMLVAPALAGAQPATPTVPSPPAQPVTGAGGADYLFDDVTARHYGPEPDGSAVPDGYWLFEPAFRRDGTPGSPRLPLILFFHGYTGPTRDPTTPGSTISCGAAPSWSIPIGSRGTLSECPKTQQRADHLPNDVAAITAALAELQSRRPCAARSGAGGPLRPLLRRHAGRPVHRAAAEAKDCRCRARSCWRVPAVGILRFAVRAGRSPLTRI